MCGWPIQVSQVRKMITGLLGGWHFLECHHPVFSQSEFRAEAWSLVASQVLAFPVVDLTHFLCALSELPIRLPFPNISVKMKWLRIARWWPQHSTKCSVLSWGPPCGLRGSQGFCFSGVSLKLPSPTLSSQDLEATAEVQGDFFFCDEGHSSRHNL